MLQFLKILNKKIIIQRIHQKIPLLEIKTYINEIFFKY